MQRAVMAVSTATAAVRRTRIVATIGAANADPACLAALIRAGVDVVRLSMVNGSRERHLATVRTVRAEADRQGRTVSVLADLQGRKNRIGRLRDGAARWEPGEKVVLAAAPGDLDSHRTWLIHGWRAVPQAGSHVLIDDGAVVLRVEEADDSTMTCTVTQGGPVTDGRGVTLPGRQPIPVGLTPRDRDDAAFARHLGADMIALSFTAHPSDREALHRIAPEAALIAKIEHPDAVRALPPLIDAFDGLMVARGTSPWRSCSRTCRWCRSRSPRAARPADVARWWPLNCCTPCGPRPVPPAPRSPTSSTPYSTVPTTWCWRARPDSAAARSTWWTSADG